MTHWLGDPALGEAKKALAAVLHGRVSTRARPPGRIESVITGLTPAPFSRLHALAHERNVPLTLAASALLPAGLPAPFSGARLVLLVQVSTNRPAGQLEIAPLLGDALRRQDAAEPPVLPAPILQNVGYDTIRETLRTMLARVQGAEAAGLAQPGERAIAHAWMVPGTYDVARPLRADMAAEALHAMRRQVALVDRPVFCFGAKPWNHKAIAAAFGTDVHPLSFCKDAGSAIADAAASGGRVLGWAAGVSNADEASATNAGVDLWRIEDGFLRSVGLGAGLARGAALAFDDCGIYFDATRESRMERLLNGRQLTPGERARAQELRRRIVSARMTKYNVGARGPVLAAPPGREAILVPGQVADDAGVRRSLSDVIDCAGCANVNLDLLRAVRARNPDAWIVYKPHPDVEARLRAGRLETTELRGLADHIVAGGSIVDVIETVDRVETFSSLAGFEALLRDTPVTVHGMPFYAGWGLTQDLTEMPRRSARLDLETLVHVAFVDYPVTLDPKSLRPCPPEVLIERLVAQRADPVHGVIRLVRQHASWFGRKIGL
ncbi:capsular biosynthesis protein [Stappia sp. ES.058]|uniref:capsular polysaccharide export protein, LipB/KpsS family n=1 Tax=Stappia sp. ES.058 TaxID=1881061 RepID=UPI00087A37AC|nr:capsular biosynthesis protein [Stappia sp. ES.058]SDU02266.1 capsular polysaccharide export protein [Stappia sp. ES.058]